jgi:NTE family protein
MARPSSSKSRSPRRRADAPVLVDLALQGGGSHGAFTWGVLDRAIQEPRLRIEGISGTSAGAMNAAVMASGLASGGVDGARQALEDFWRRVSIAAQFSPYQRTPLDVLCGKWSLDDSPLFMALDMASRVFSPYDLNPGGYNPLAAILEQSIDFDRLATAKTKLFITATNVRTGRGRVFRNTEINADVLLASACLPMMFRAVEIDGDPYWDGGYTGNPTITPLVRECASSDTVLVQISPIERADTPTSAFEINERVKEIAFNASLLKELRMMAMLRRVADPGTGEGRRWGGMRIHRIGGDDLAGLGSSSKLNAEWAFLCLLRDKGRQAVERFMAAHGRDLNQRSSFDLDAFLDGV